MREKRIKKAFTLIEVIIALSLFVVVVSTIFGIFSTVSRSEKVLLTAQEKTQRFMFFQMRMKALFSRLIKEEKKGSSLFTLEGGSPSLMFMFANRANIDPEFGDKVIGRLIVDDTRLMLLTWPLPEEKKTPKKMREEILLKNVQAVEYEFFGNLSKTRDKQTADWQKTTFWEKDSISRPLRVTFKITFTDDTEASFWFLLQKQIQAIPYT